jgi:hypothetical protein
VDWLWDLTWLYNVVLHVGEDDKLKTLEYRVLRGTTEQQTGENCTRSSFVICMPGVITVGEIGATCSTYGREELFMQGLGGERTVGKK